MQALSVSKHDKILSEMNQICNMAHELWLAAQTIGTFTTKMLVYNKLTHRLDHML